MLGVLALVLLLSACSASYRAEDGWYRSPLTGDWKCAATIDGPVPECANQMRRDAEAERGLAIVLAGIIVRWSWQWEAKRRERRRLHPSVPRISEAVSGDGWDRRRVGLDLPTRLGRAWGRFRRWSR